MSKKQGLKRVGRISDVCESIGTSSETIQLLHEKNPQYPIVVYVQQEIAQMRTFW